VIYTNSVHLDLPLNLHTLCRS